MPVSVSLFCIKCSQFRFSSIANSYDFTSSLLAGFFKEILSQFLMAIFFAFKFKGI